MFAGIAISATAIYLGACSSGNSNNSQTSGGTGNTTTAPMGPISYKMVQDKTAFDKVNFVLLKTRYNQSLKSTVSSSYNFPAGNVTFSDPFTNQNACPASLSAMSINGLGAASSTVGLVSSALNFIPVLGSALSFFGSAIASALGFASNVSSNVALTNCMAYTDAQFAQDFNTVQTEINNIQDKLTSVESDILLLQSEIVTNAMSIAGINTQNLSQAEVVISGSSTIDGLTQVFLQDAGLINQSSESTGLTLLDATTSNYASLSSLVNSNITNFQIALQNYTGSGILANCTGSCYNMVQQESGSALILTYQSIYNAYKDKINSALLQNQNIVPAMKDYDNTLAYLFLQSVFNLQSAFSLEFMINKANYFASLRNLGSQYQISSLGNVAGTYYGYTAIESSNITAQTNAYNQAQQQLVSLYAARFNQLYVNTIQYMMSDVPAPFQIESNTLTYTDVNGQLTTVIESNAYLANVGINVVTPLSYLPGTLWKNGYNGTMHQSGILMQANGLKDPALCTSAIESYISNSAYMNIGESLGAINCPSLYAANTGVATESGYYDGITLAPYMANANNNSIVLTQPVYNMLSSCALESQIGATNADMYFWMPSAANSPTGESAAYLLCTIWNPDVNSSAATSPFSPYYILGGGASNNAQSPANWIGYTTFGDGMPSSGNIRMPFVITASPNSQMRLTPLASSEPGIFYSSNSPYGSTQFYGYPLGMESGTGDGALWFTSPTTAVVATPSILSANLNITSLDGFNAPFGVGYILYDAAIPNPPNASPSVEYFPVEEMAISCGAIESNVVVISADGSEVPLCITNSDGSITYYGKKIVKPTISDTANYASMSVEITNLIWYTAPNIYRYTPLMTSGVFPDPFVLPIQLNLSSQ